MTASMGLVVCKGEVRERTSLSALMVQTPYVTARMPPKRIAVLARQFEGRVHQPPNVSSDPRSDFRAHWQVIYRANETERETDNGSD